MSVTVQVYSDPICPWCYIGKRRFERAAATLRDGGTSVGTEWRCFRLNPDMPPEGMDRRGYLRAKFGSDAQADLLYARIEQAAKMEGLDVRFDLIRRTPDTLAIHKLIHDVQGRDPSRADALVESLFRAFFTEGRDIGDRAQMLAIAESCGIGSADAASAMDSPTVEQRVIQIETEGRAMGISGVPAFAMNGQLIASGAQPPDALVAALSQAR